VRHEITKAEIPEKSKLDTSNSLKTGNPDTSQPEQEKGALHGRRGQDNPWVVLLVDCKDNMRLVGVEKTKGGGEDS